MERQIPELSDIYEKVNRLEHMRQIDAAAGDPIADLERGLRDLYAARIASGAVSVRFIGRQIDES